MNALRSGLQTQQMASVFDYRLNDDPFYFKFCRSDAFEPDTMSMIKGLFLTASDVEHFLKSDAAKGPKGGVFLSYDNLKRNYPNTLFVSLARGGWIGSRADGSKTIEKFIEEALSDGRSVNLASISTPRDVEEFGATE